MNFISIAGKVSEISPKTTSASGIALMKFVVSVDKHNKGELDQFEVTVFRDLADTKLEVGQFVGITGKLSSNNYDKDDKKYYNCSIVGSNISLLGK